MSTSDRGLPVWPPAEDRERATFRPPWVLQPRKLYSLEDMLTFAAHDFQALMRVLPDFRCTDPYWITYRGEPTPEEIARNEEYSRKLDAALRTMLAHCKSLKMPASVAAIHRMLQDPPTPPFGGVRQDFKEIESRIHDELAAQVFLYVSDPEYYDTPDWIGIETRMRFESVTWEAREAATCYALERYTACVFHLMRILEFGLAALAGALNVNITNPNWHQVLLACEAKIGTLKDHDPNWKVNEQFYNRVALEFRHFQRAVRNHTAHAREKYDQAEAKILLDHVGSFMKHIASRLHEVPMPTQTS